MKSVLRLLLTPLLFVLLLSPILPARIISYAPVTDQLSRPAIQVRDNRFYLLFESAVGFQPPPPISAPVPPPPATGTLVLHDVTGEEEPQTILPSRPAGYQIDALAMHTASNGSRRILLGANFDPANPEVAAAHRYVYSADGGTTWHSLPLPSGARIPEFFRADVGGPFVRGRGAQIRLGNDSTPFVFTAQTMVNGVRHTTLYAVDANGTLRQLVAFSPGTTAMLVGSDQAGARFLIIGRPETSTVPLPNGLRVLHLDGRLTDVATTDSLTPHMEGWITGGGEVYVESQPPGQPQKISIFRGSSEEVLLTVPRQIGANPVLFAVPAAAYDGAWIIRREASQPTALLHHSPASGLVTQWSDITSPEVEAIHPARSGQRLLVQVHRPRAMQTQIIIDPALAIWEIGTPAPQRYEELFLAEGPAKGFVSLDVDAAANGAPFVFDSAPVQALPPPPVSSAPGGGDIVQEWGVVRASLHQRLVIPALARLPGGYGSFWKSDLILQNPDSRPVDVALRFTDSGNGEQHERSMQLGPHEIRHVPDALEALFGLQQGGGALFLTPDPGRSIVATSRTYNDTGSGTYGMGVGASDIYAASSSRFFLSYSGAFQGIDSRTNLLVTDAGTRGVRFGMRASGPSGVIGRTEVEFEAPPRGQIQINDVASWLWIGDQQGALRFSTLRGQAIASLVSIDNLTNDPTLFPPDVAAGAPRMIPIIGHLDGGHGSRFRTDLFLFNPSDNPRSILLQTRPLDRSAPDASIWITLLARESKVIRDVYHSLFNRTGTGRLLFTSGGMIDSNGIRVSARIYSEREDGGTYGYVMPALNAFQSAGPGESIEILGAVIDPQFRTNLALVDPAWGGNGTLQRIRVEIFATGGQRLDTFEVQVPLGGGTQLVDLFNARNLQSMTRTPVVIRISPTTGQIAGFATMIDNQTNDPLYLGAGLSAQP